MNSKQFKVIFRGELLPNFTISDVKNSLKQQLNTDESKLELLFSGAIIVFKKNISIEQAISYREKCNSLGLLTYIEETIVTTTMKPTPVNSINITTAPSPKQSEITNLRRSNSDNKHFEIMTKGELLSGFSISKVKKLLKQQFHFDDDKLEWLFSGATVVLKKNMDIEQANNYCQQLNSFGLITYLEEEPQLEDDNSTVTAPAIWGLNCSGRYGRLNFLSTSLLIYLISLIITWIFLANFDKPTLTLVILHHLLIIILLLFYLRTIILRLHDLNISAWWALIFLPSLCYIFVLLQILVPFNKYFYLSMVTPQWILSSSVILIALTIALLTFPGIAGENYYGLPAKKANFFIIIVLLFFTFLVSIPVIFAWILIMGSAGRV